MPELKNNDDRDKNMTFKIKEKQVNETQEQTAVDAKEWVEKMEQRMDSRIESNRASEKVTQKDYAVSITTQ